MLEAALLLGRFLQFAAAILLFGAPLFLIYGVSSDTVARDVRRLLRGAAITAVVAASLLLVVQTAEMTGSAQDAFNPEMTGSAQDAFNPEMLWVVAFDTHYGAVWSLRLGLIALALAAAIWARQTRAVWAAQTGLGALILATLAFTGHGGMGEGAVGDVHRIADILHLLAAGAWLGALPLLLMLMMRAARDGSEKQAALNGLVRFSAIGPGVVAILVLSGIVNAWALIGPTNVIAALGAPYGQTLAIKLALVLAMLGLAGWNRWKLSPLLREGTDAASDARAAQRLSISVGLETALAVVVLALVAMLGVLEPPMPGE